MEARNRQGDLLVLPLEDDSSGYRVAEIEGLDPVKATIVSTSFANMDGEQDQSARREPRDIKIQVELVPDPETDTVYGLRKGIYKFFMPKTIVFLRFYMEDGLEVDITGRVETCEAALFTREPAVNVSIRCSKPDFIDLTPEVVPGTTTSGSTPLIIDYAGSIETGIQLVLNVDRSLSNFSVYHTPPGDELRTLDFDNVPLVAGDVLTINTVRGPTKGATLVRAGVTSSVLRGVSPQASWLELQPGSNSLLISAAGADIPLAIQYNTRYGGL